MDTWYSDDETNKMSTSPQCIRIRKCKFGTYTSTGMTITINALEDEDVNHHNKMKKKQFKAACQKIILSCLQSKK